MTPLKEDALDQCREYANSICRFLDKNTHIWYDLIDYDSYPMNTSVVTFKVEGDWRRDHMAFKQAIRDWADQMDKEIFKIDEQEIGSSDSDDYTAQYSVFIASDKESMRILNSMRGLFAEGLNQKEKQIYVKAVNEAEDIEDLEDICHEIYFYDKKLFAHINKFPKDASFEDIKANILKNLQESLSESFSADEIDKLESDIKNMKIDDSITVKNYKNGDMYKFVKRNDGNQISAFENVLGKNHMASPQQVFGWAKDSLIYANFKPKFSKNEFLKESTMPYATWVKRAKDGEWVMWGGSYSDELDPDFLYEINHPNFPNNNYNIENQYIDAMILPAGKEPVDESLTEDTIKTKDGKSLNELYVGEPDIWADKEHTRSFYDNPKDWEFQLQDIRDILSDLDNQYAIKSKSPWGCTICTMNGNKPNYSDVVYSFDFWEDKLSHDEQVKEFLDLVDERYSNALKEDTVKTKDGKWTNKGDEGTHGKFRTKKEADAQRKAMFANGLKEGLDTPIFVVKVFQNYPFNGCIELMDKLDKNGEGEKHCFTNRKELNDYAKMLVKSGYKNWQGYPLNESIPGGRYWEPGYDDLEMFDSGYKYEIRGYFDSQLRELYDVKRSNDWSSIEDYAYRWLDNGNYVVIENLISGKSVVIDPNEDWYEGDFLYKSEDLEESLKEGATKLDIIKSNKSLYNRITLAASKMPDGLKKSILLYYALPWCKNNNWLGGMPDSATNKVIYRLMGQGYDQDEIMDEIDRFIDCFVDTYSSFSGENNKLSKYLQESLKESYYKLCWYDSDPDSGFYGDKFDCYAVVKAFDAKDAQEKFKDLLLRTGDELDRDRIRYFKNFTDYLRDSEMYIDDATEDEYNEYKDYQDARFESLKEDLADKFLRIHDGDEYNWNLHNTDYTRFYDILKRYMKPGETWDEEDEEGYPLDTNVKLDTLFRRMPKSEQHKFMKEFDLHGAYNESLKEDFSNFDLINYNDFLANNFDGWSDDIDYLISELNKVARALRTTARKLVFYVDYNEEFWAADEIADVTLYLNDDYSIYEAKNLGIKFAAMIPDNVWIFKNENEANQIINNVKAFNSELEEDDLQEALIKNKKFKRDFFKTVNKALTKF